MKAVAVAILIMITQFIVVFVAVSGAGNFPSIPASEPITAFKPSEKIPAGRCTPTTEIKSAPSNECQCRRSPEDQIFLYFFICLFTILIGFLIFKVVHLIYNKILQWRWYRENRQSLILMWRGMVKFMVMLEVVVEWLTLIQDIQNIWNRRGSVREGHAACFQGDVDSVTPTEETLSDPASMVTPHCGLQAWVDCWKEYMQGGSDEKANDRMNACLAEKVTKCGKSSKLRHYGRAHRR
jgi:hypothetical protein